MYFGKLLLVTNEEKSVLEELKIKTLAVIQQQIGLWPMPYVADKNKMYLHDFLSAIYGIRIAHNTKHNIGLIKEYWLCLYHHYGAVNEVHCLINEYCIVYC